MNSVQEEVHYRVNMILMMADDLKKLNLEKADEDVEIVAESIKIEIDRALLALRLARFLKDE